MGALVLALVLALPLMNDGKVAPVSMIVRPTIMTQRGDIRVEVRVPRHEANRILSISWVSDGPGTWGTELRQLDGESGPVLHVLWLPGSPAANYYFTASVFDTHGQPRGRAEAKILVPDDGGY
jgi:hypothetical protein